MSEHFTKIQMSKDGPYLITGSFQVIDNEGHPLNIQNAVMLCACGASSKKLFCDGTHKAIGYSSSAVAK